MMTKPQTRLDRTWVIVTGGSRGIGAGLVSAFHGAAIAQQAMSFNLFATARRPSAVALPGTFVALDLAQAVTQPSDWYAVIDQQLLHGIEHAERVILINNAGRVDPLGALSTLNPEALAEHFAVNVHAPLLLAERLLAATPKAAHRLIINISSGAALRPIAGWGAYCASKAALELATRVSAVEHADGRTDICLLAPGIVDTDMQATLRAAGPEAFPDHANFVALKANNQLSDATVLGQTIVQHVLAGSFKNGERYDIRQMPALDAHDAHDAHN